MQIFNEFTLLQDQAYIQAFAQLALTISGFSAQDIVAAIAKELPEAVGMLESWSQKVQKQQEERQYDASESSDSDDLLASGKRDDARKKMSPKTPKLKKISNQSKFDSKRDKRVKAEPE